MPPTLELVERPDLFMPNPGGQQAFMDDYASRYCALAGGWYAGKTWAGARKLLDIHLFNAFDDEGYATGVDSCIIAPTYQLGETINIPEFKQALDQANVRYRFVADSKKYWFELPQLAGRSDPSLVYVRTADAPDKITGFTVGALWGDEVARWKTSDTDPTADPLLQAKGRLRDSRARCLQFLMTFTHEGDATKVYEDFEDDPRPDHKLYRAGTFDNPHAREFGEELRGQLTEELANQYLGGVAARLRGKAVYSAFVNAGPPAGNVSADVRLDPSAPLHWSFDFNIAPGMFSVVGQHFPGQDLVTARHLIHGPSLDVRGTMEAFKTLMERNYGGGFPFPELHLFGDASGESRWAGNSESCWDIVRDYLKRWGTPHRLKVPASNPHVTDRVNAVNCALRDIDGRVHYLIHPDCAALIRDFRRMKWDEKGELDKSDRNLSHPSDAEGYRVKWVRPLRPLRLAKSYGGSAVTPAGAGR